MRHTEFWDRMEQALGASYARFWADQQVIADLGGRTVTEALAAGEAPKRVWRSVAEQLDVPSTLR